MSKFRLIQNNDTWYIQEKFLFFFWTDHSVIFDELLPGFPFKIGFSDKNQASVYMENLENGENPYVLFNRHFGLKPTWTIDLLKQREE
jgi:hypothetical protein